MRTRHVAVLLLVTGGLARLLNSVGAEAPHVVHLNEYLPMPRDTDWNGDEQVDAADEWVELINTGTSAVDLKGWRIDDGPGGGDAVVLEVETRLEPGELLVVYLGKSLLNNSGDRLQLLWPDGQVVEETHFTAVGADRSISRLPDGTGMWQETAQPSPGAHNGTSSTTTPAATSSPLATETSSVVPTPTCARTLTQRQRFSSLVRVAPSMQVSLTPTRTRATASATPIPDMPCDQPAVSPQPSPQLTATSPVSPTELPVGTPTPRSALPTLMATPDWTSTPIRTFAPTHSPTPTLVHTPTTFPTSAATLTPHATQTYTPVPASTPSITPGQVTVQLNEYLPIPAHIDWNGDGQADATDEWVELINVGTNTMDLEGWRIDDGPRGGGAVILGAGTDLGPGELLLVHLRRALLNNEGDRLQLLRPDGTVVGEVSFTAAEADRSMSRLPDGSGIWEMNTPATPGVANRPPEPTATSTSTPTATWTPTSEPSSTSTRVPSPTSTQTQTPASTSTSTSTQTPASTTIPTWTGTPEAVYTPTAPSSDQTDPVELATATHVAALSPTGTVQTTPRINEYLAAPRDIDWNGDGQANAADEWVELINVGKSVVSLEGWRLDDGPGGGAAVVLGTGTQLEPNVLLVVYLGRSLLNNGGDWLQLLRPDGTVVEQVSFTAAEANRSASRLPDGTGSWEMNTPATPGTANRRASSPLSSSTATITATDPPHSPTPSRPTVARSSIQPVDQTAPVGTAMPSPRLVVATIILAGSPVSSTMALPTSPNVMASSSTMIDESVDVLLPNSRVLTAKETTVVSASLAELVQSTNVPLPVGAKARSVQQAEDTKGSFLPLLLLGIAVFALGLELLRSSRSGSETQI